MMKINSSKRINAIIYSIGVISVALEGSDKDQLLVIGDLLVREETLLCIHIEHGENETRRE